MKEGHRIVQLEFSMLLSAPVITTESAFKSSIESELNKKEKSIGSQKSIQVPLIGYKIYVFCSPLSPPQQYNRSPP